VATRRPGSAGGITIPRPESGTLALILAFTGSYVAYLLLLRLGIGVAEYLPLVPSDVVRGQAWRLVTSVFLHAENSPGHLIMNMLMLWIFGNQVERQLGRPAYFKLCAWSGIAGAVATTLLGGVFYLVFGGSNDWGLIWLAPTVGASGVVMGIIFCWTALQWGRSINLFLLGEMKAQTFALILIVIELLTALSYSMDSWTSHLGGAGMGFLIGRGLWPPRGLRKSMAKRKHQKTQQRLRRFEVIEGGRGDDADDTAGPPLWGGGDKGGPTVH
jgi:membrane associated rhomboid family serine protease